MKVQFVSRNAAIKAGYNFQGTTTDASCLVKIQRDYLATGNYDSVVFARFNHEGLIGYYARPKAPESPMVNAWIA